MLDIYGRHNPAPRTPLIRNAEFFRVELSPTTEGKIFVSLTATTVDDEEPQLLDQEIAIEQVTSLDDVLALIRTHVRIAPYAPMV